MAKEIRRERQEEAAKLSRFTRVVVHPASASAPHIGTSSNPSGPGQHIGSNGSTSQKLVDYMNSQQFKWKHSTVENMRRVWGIQSFR